MAMDQPEMPLGHALKNQALQGMTMPLVVAEGSSTGVVIGAMTVVGVVVGPVVSGGEEGEGTPDG